MPSSINSYVIVNTNYDRGAEHFLVVWTPLNSFFIKNPRKAQQQLDTLM